jgi:hypothetical protein
MPEAAIKPPELCFYKKSGRESRTVLKRKEPGMALFFCNRDDSFVAVRLALNQLVCSVSEKNTKVIYIL